MDNDGLEYRRFVRPWTVDYRYPNLYINEAGAEWDAGSLSTHYPNFPGGHWHGQLEDVYYSTGTQSTAETPCVPLFNTQLPYVGTYVEPEGASFRSFQPGSVHVNPQQLLFYDYTPQVPAMVSDNVPWDLGLNQDMGKYPPPPEQLYPQSGAVPGPIFSLAQPPYVPPSLPKNEVADIASGVSMEDTLAHDEDKCCPVCPASVHRPQDRKRHKLSHLPYWLQCPEPGCSWRGRRWENLEKHHPKVHPSSSRELDTRKSMIYNPWRLVEDMTDATAFENAKIIAIALVEERGEELKKSRLWGDIWGRKKRGPRRLYGTLSD